jgi:hypothetical protein
MYFDLLSGNERHHYQRHQQPPSCASFDENSCKLFHFVSWKNFSKRSRENRTEPTRRYEYDAVSDAGEPGRHCARTA